MDDAAHKLRCYERQELRPTGACCGRAVLQAGAGVHWMWSVGALVLWRSARNHGALVQHAPGYLGVRKANP